MTAQGAPRVVLVSQWPGLKNAEYELIERVKRTGFDVAVVDFLGFDVETGECINDARLPQRYDFAVSFHYETPKFLNLPTYFWVANPLEFMHGQGSYRNRLIHHIRSYDDYLYNGSEVLKEHIRRVVGSEWRDTGLAFVGACSRNAMIPPRPPGRPGAKQGKLFYCGVNWEAITDKAGRAQGLLDILQARDAADFYGPRTLLGVNTWEGFSSYRGEIPFDGASIFPAMSEYDAVLAVSSPAHIKSQTSSGRAVEGFAAGVPVISDENAHVRRQFGDLVYYFGGESEEERADAVLAALGRIRARPDEALERVAQAQRLIATEYCFEACLERTLAHVVRARDGKGAATGPTVDVFLVDHDPYARDASAPGPANAGHVLAAAAAAARRLGAKVRIVATGTLPMPAGEAAPGVEWVALGAPDEAHATWRCLRLGQKLARLAAGCTADHAVFLTQEDFPHHDYLVRLLEPPPGEALPAVSLGGFYVNDLAARAPASAHGVLTNNASESLYRWSPNSVAEHHLGQFRFGRAALAAIDFGKLDRFDVMLPLALVMECRTQALAMRRLRHVVLRLGSLYLHKYQRAFGAVASKGYWAQQYELLTNSTQELNALYDAFHEDAAVVATLDRVVGHDAPPVDPAVHTVNAFIQTLLPFYRLWLGFKRRVLRRRATA